MPHSSKREQRLIAERVLSALREGGEPPDDADLFALRGMAISARERAMNIEDLARIVLARLREQDESAAAANSSGNWQ